MGWGGGNAQIKIDISNVTNQSRLSKYYDSVSRRLDKKELTKCNECLITNKLLAKNKYMMPKELCCAPLKIHLSLAISCLYLNHFNSNTPLIRY